MNDSPRLHRLRRLLPWAPVAIALLACCAYGIVVGGDFVFDDRHSVAGNAALVESGAMWRALTDPSAFSAAGHRMYRPALLVSFVLNLAVSEAAWSLKAGNLLLHATAGVLLLAWLRALRVRARVAFALAAVFVVHPLLSESVNLISARSELLFACGLLVAARCHLAWQRGRRPMLTMCGMLVGTAIACGSKETGVVLPVVLLAQALWSRTDHGRNWRRAVAGILPVVVLVAAYLVTRRLLLGQATVDVLSRVAGDPTTGHGRTLAVQLGTMATLLPRALLQMVAPIGLTLDPPAVFRHVLSPWSLLGWTSVAGLAIAAAWPGPTARVRRIGLVTVIVTALPWIVVPLNLPLAEHRLYAPMLGTVVVVAALASRVRLRSPLPIGAIATAIAVVVGITMSITRSLDYRDEFRLYSAEIERRSTSFHGWWGLGAARLREGDFEGAIEPLLAAHLLRPENVEAVGFLTEALVQLPEERQQPALTMFAADRALAFRPDNPWFRTLHARALMVMGRANGDRSLFEQAEREALSCLDIAAPKSFVYLLASEARQLAGDPEGALVHLDTSVQKGLDRVTIWLARARLLRTMGRDAEARRSLAAAQQRAPMDPAVMATMREFAAPPR